MAKQTTNWTADSGTVYDTEFDALRDDLRGYFGGIGVKFSSDQIVDKIANDLPGFADTIARLNEVRPEQPGKVSAGIIDEVGKILNIHTMQKFTGIPRPLDQLGARARCMGGSQCRHTVGQCTADPEYQAAIVLERNSAEAASVLMR